MKYQERLGLTFAFFYEQQLGYLEGTMREPPLSPRENIRGRPEASHSQIQTAEDW